MASVRDDRRLHDIYRMRDLSGRLLYIGVTNGGLRRFMEHAKDKTWWREVTTIDIEHVHCSRSVIETIEREAIQAERPLYNVVHNEQRSHVDEVGKIATEHTMAEILNGANQAEARRALGGRVVRPAHRCTDGSTCPTVLEFITSLKRPYYDLSDSALAWIRSILEPHYKREKVSSNVKGAMQIAVLTLIAREQIDYFGDEVTEHASRRLQFIMHGGWGAPFDAFHEVSASDCVTILHTYFDPEDVEAIGYVNQELCAFAAERATA